MSLAVVRNLGAPAGLRSELDVDDFEQELVDQYALAMAAAGLSDGHIAESRAIVVEFARSLPGRIWTATVDDTDRFLAELRRRAGMVVGRRSWPGPLVNRRSSPRATPVDVRYPWHRYQEAAQTLREDRILHEVHVTGGDVRRICDLFGLSIKAATRYAAALEHPELRGEHTISS